jgi:hypothetical protein
MLKCYVAGKLNADAVGYIRNMHVMIKTAKKLREIGVSVFVPCNDFLEGLVDGNFTYEDFFSNNIPWLECVDFVFVCQGWETSEGTRRELEYAKQLMIPIYYDLEILKRSIASGDI